MRYLSVLVFLAAVLVCGGASAVTVEARGFTMCTSISGGACTGGTTYIRPLTLGKKNGTSCDWSGGSCEVWVPKGVYSFSNAKGVFMSCCMETDDGETDAGYQFYFHNVETDAWQTVSTQGYMGVDPNPGACSVADLIFYGTEVDEFDPYTLWDYDSADRVARCLGWATNYNSGVPTTVTKGIEYWMDF